MTKDLFRFRHRPYAASPNVANYVPTESSEGTIEAVTGCVKRAAGSALVIGASGLGKTMLASVIAQRLQSTHQVVMLATSRLCTRRALLQNVLFELGLPYRDKEEGELRIGLLDYLRSPRNTSEGMLLIVDESNTMPARLLEEVRGLTNILRDGRPRVHLVLIGSPSFDERLAEPELDAVQQRIAVRRYLTPMTREETRRFVAQQWSASIADSHSCPFDSTALDRLYDASEGVPRLVNQTCDHALLLANARRHPQITAPMIEEAWADLQQMPNPWMVNRRDASTQAPTNTIVEFGMLDDSPSHHQISSHELERDSLTRLKEMRDLARLAAEEGIRDRELSDHHDSFEVWETEAPVVEEPIVEEVLVEELIIEEPIVEEPIVEETLAEDPFAESNFDEEEWVVSQRDRNPGATAPSNPGMTKPGVLASHEDMAAMADHDGELASLVAIESLAIEIQDELAPFEPPLQFDSIEDAEDPFAAEGFEAEELLIPQRLRESQPPQQPQQHATIAESQAAEEPTPAQLLQRFETRDDKDLIVIDDPVPRNPLRVVAAPAPTANPTKPEPPAPAIRVEYQVLFARLRGQTGS